MSDFTLESDKAILVLGHSERKKTGELWAKEIDERNYFDDIDVLTLNAFDTKMRGTGRVALLDVLARSTAITHSAGAQRVIEASQHRRLHQIVAFNGSEQTSYRQQIRSAMAIGSDPMSERSEPGAHEIDILDRMGAGLQIASSPISTARTMAGIKNGFSTSRRLAVAGRDFPAGRALVHSELDGFGFPNGANNEFARIMGVTVEELPDHYHNEVLFAPGRTMDMLTPTIFPEPSN